MIRFSSQHIICSICQWQWDKNICDFHHQLRSCTVPCVPLALCSIHPLLISAADWESRTLSNARNAHLVTDFSILGPYHPKRSSVTGRYLAVSFVNVPRAHSKQAMIATNPCWETCESRMLTGRAVYLGVIMQRASFRSPPPINPNPPIENDARSWLHLA